jgi:hypothetical protein
MNVEVLQKLPVLARRVASNYATCNDLSTGVYSRVSGTKDCIDATICELSRNYLVSCGGRLTGILEAIILRDSAGTLVACQSTGNFRIKGRVVSKIALLQEVYDDLRKRSGAGTLIAGQSTRSFSTGWLSPRLRTTPRDCKSSR